MNKILLFFALTLGLLAVEGDFSVTVAEQERHFVSEEVVLKVDLKTTAFSIRDAKIGLDNTKDYIILAPKSASSLETVERNDTQWQVVHYEYKLYPLHAGKMTIRPIELSFKASMGYGQPDNNFTFLSDALILDISAPEGVGKNDFVLSTGNYSLKSDISLKSSEHNMTKIKVGDAIEIRVTQEAKNVPDILLEPLHFSEDPHLNIYKEEPILSTKTVDSETTATRIDAFTFLAKKEGNVSIPAQTFIWWDPVEKVLHKEKTTALHFIVLPNPKSASSTMLAKEKKEDKLWVPMILLGLILLVIFYNIKPYMIKWRAEKKLAYEQSEKGRFKRLIDACQGSDARTLYHDFYHWLEVASPKLSQLGFRGIRKMQPSFSASLHELEEVLSVHEHTFDKIRFAKELKTFREILLKQQQNKQQGLPQNINPVQD